MPSEAITFLGHQAESGATVEVLASDFHRVDARYERVWAEGQLRLAATLGHDSQGSDPTYLTDKSAALRLAIEAQLSSVLRLRAGAEGRIDDYGLEQGAPAEPNEAVVPSNVDPPPTNFTTSAHADVIWRVLGIAHQYPVLRVGALPAPVAAGSGFLPGNSELQRTLQVTQGMDLRLVRGDSRGLRLEVSSCSFSCA